MADDERITHLEQRVRELQERVYSMEAYLTRTSPTVIHAPPVVRVPNPGAPPPPPPVNIPNPGWQAAPGGQPQTPFAPAKPDAEYQFGAQILPRIGAVVFLLGVLYLVALGISRGFITLRTQFIGEQILCAAFVVFGLIKRNEKEGYGQLLVGIGSCGFYLSFAGAHVFKHLISAETLVALFMALSFANLAFSWWRSSKSFLSIGLLGGLAGAMLPLDRPNLPLHGGLELSIVVAAALIIARYGWIEFAVGLWIAAMAAFGPALMLNKGPFDTEIAYLYVIGLVCFAAAAKVRRWTHWDSSEVFLPISIFATAFLGFCYQSGSRGAAEVGMYAVAVGGITLLFRKDAIAFYRLLLGAAATLLVLAPAGFPDWSVAIYCALSLILAPISLRRPGRTVLILCWVMAGMATGAYLYLATWQRPWNEEVQLLLGMGASYIGASYALLKHGKGLGKVREEVLAGAAFLTTLVFARIGFVVGFRLDPVHRSNMSLVVTMLILGTIWTSLARWRRSPGIAIAALATFAWATCSYITMANNERVFIGEDVILLPLLMALAVYLGAVSLKLGSDRESTLAFGTIAVWGFFTRLSYVLLTRPQIGLTDMASITVAWIVFAIALIGLGFGFKVPTLRFMSLGLFMLTLAKVLLFDLEALDPAIRIGVLMALGLAMLAGGYWYIKSRHAGDTKPSGM
jgi:hypothetical protein